MSIYSTCSNQFSVSLKLSANSIDYGDVGNEVFTIKALHLFFHHTQSRSLLQEAPTFILFNLRSILFEYKHICNFIHSVIAATKRFV